MTAEFREIRSTALDLHVIFLVTAKKFLTFIKSQNISASCFCDFIYWCKMYFGHDIEFTKHALTVLTTTELSIQVRSCNIIKYPENLSVCQILVKNSTKSVYSIQMK